jgi:hypothetical protein
MTIHWNLNRMAFHRKVMRLWKRVGNMEKYLHHKKAYFHEWKLLRMAK